MHKRVFVIGDGATLTFHLVHNIGTLDVVVAVRENKLPGELVVTNVSILSKDSVEISFGNPPGNNEYAVTVIG